MEYDHLSPTSCNIRRGMGAMPVFKVEIEALFEGTHILSTHAPHCTAIGYPTVTLREKGCCSTDHPVRRRLYTNPVFPSVSKYLSQINY